MDKDKELEDMMKAIKNLKDQDTRDMNINKEATTVAEKTDTSFYSRIFHHQIRLEN